MDVVRSNFEDIFPQIEKALRQCDFVGKIKSQTKDYIDQNNYVQVKYVNIEY